MGSYTQGVACNQRQSYRYIVDWPAKYFQMDWNTIIGVKPPYIAQLAGLIGRSISFLNRVVWKVILRALQNLTITFLNHMLNIRPTCWPIWKDNQDEVTLIEIRNIAYGKIIMVLQFGMTSRMEGEAYGRN